MMHMDINMKTSKRFGKVSVIHEGIHYFANGFTYFEKNVNSKVAHKVGNSWIEDNIIITIELANELIEYAENH